MAAESSAIANATVLSAAIGAYPHTRPLLEGRVRSDLLTLEFVDVKPINKAFAPMVREARFDVCEMAIATFLQAKAWGKPLALLPIVLAARFQETALFCRNDSAIKSPADLKGRRIGVRAYSQTTGMWLRGILEESHDVLASDIRWTTFEPAHVTEYIDPPWVERAAAGEDMMGMLREGRLDAVIVGNEAPGDPALRTVFPDPQEAGRAFHRRYGFAPVNHVVTLRSEFAAARPECVRELMWMFRESADVAHAALSPSGRPALQPAVELATRYSIEQGLLPSSFQPAEAWDGLPSGVE